MKYNKLHLNNVLRSTLLFLMLCIAGLPKSYAYDFSAVCETGQTLYYNITNAVYHYVELTHPSNSGWSGYTEPTGNIILPRYVYDADDNQYFVTSIGDYAFNGCYGLTGDLIIPNYVTSIGERAFGRCIGITSLTISNSVTSISNRSFEACSGFEQIVVQSQNTVYDSRDNCNAIIETSTNKLIFGCKNTIIPNTVTSIGSYAFWYCNRLTSLSIPNSVITIGMHAFENCYGLTSLIIPNSVTSIDDYAFENCWHLTSITISNSVTSINYGTFKGCSSLTSFTIPNSVTTIGNFAFNGCRELSSISFPNSVTSINYAAFADCRGLTSISIPNTMTAIDSAAFAGCIGIEQMVVESGNTVYDSRNNCNAIIETSTNKLISACKNTIIPNTVTSIGDYAFCLCTVLTSVTIPNSVTEIGNSAFASCTGLTSITIPNSVTSIGKRAFNSVVGGLNPISSINMLCNTPPTIESSSFPSTTIEEIYVPYESLNAYKIATNWSDYESKIYPMAYKTISGYETNNGNWAFIASPLVANTAPTAIENMITDTEYDLYYFDQTGGDNGLEWKNYKAHTNDFTIANGKGYLYANKEDVNLIFKGTFNENSTKTINLIYEAGEPLAGWNLVGNPFPVAATVTGSSYYVMNAEGTQIDPIAVSSGGTIAPCTGIMVQATVLGQPITFTRESRQVSSNNGTLQIAVAQNNTRSNSVLDKAIISFNEGDELSKFVFNKDNAKLYIPQGNEDYAIAFSEKQGKMPLNFEAKENGSYTISVNPESVEMAYLHLIDNMTGTDIDLLATSNYTFEAKTSDYASRFRLVFSAGGDTNDENEEPFAFVSNGNIIVTGDYANATLQIVDMLGRVVVNTDVAHNVSTNGIASGVYVLRLINGNDVKTQKIVIR